MFIRSSEEDCVLIRDVLSLVYMTAISVRKSDFCFFLRLIFLLGNYIHAYTGAWAHTWTRIHVDVRVQVGLPKI